MLSQEIQFAVIVKDGKVVQVGKSEVFQLQTAQDKKNKKERIEKENEKRSTNF